MKEALERLGWSFNGMTARYMMFYRITSQPEYLSIGPGWYIHQDGLGNSLFDRDTSRVCRRLGGI